MMAPQRPTPLDVLRQHWGYASFRPLQAEIIDSVIGGHDTIGLLPTGGGKSITFQVPATLMDGLTVVVTPLISLMKDQVDNAAAVGIKATAIHSGLSRPELRLAHDRCRLGKVKLLYLSPEKLQRKEFVDELSTWPVCLIVVDEAHCISQWGYDFRPSYLKIADIRRRLPHCPVLALTASATPEVVDDIAAQLMMKDERRFARSFRRDNISYVVRHADHKEAMMMRVLTRTEGSAIVYVRSRRRTRELAEVISRHGITADYYHAGLDPDDKNKRQDSWKAGQTRVMVATNAFGMGIDKPDVRVVVHHDMPSSLEEYYQEAGRAGRDGLPSYAVLIVSNADKGVLTRRLSDSFPPKEFISRIYDRLCVHLDIAMGEGYDHVYECDTPEFCRRNRLQPEPTRSALSLLSRSGYIDYIDEPMSRSRVMITADRHELYNIDLPVEAENVLHALMRTYTGLFADYVPISEPLIASHTGYTEQTVYQAMLTLGRLHAVSYVPRSSTPRVYFPQSRQMAKHVAIPAEVYDDRRKRMEQRIEAMKAYAFATDSCRVKLMLRYFGDRTAGDCGMCDICRSHRAEPRHHTADAADAEARIIGLLESLGGEATMARLSGPSHHTPDPELIEAVRRLADRGDLTIDGSTVRLIRAGH